MGIYNIFIVSKSGGLIYHYDHNIPQRETEKTFSYPLDIKLELDNKRVTVVFGERDGIKIGHTLLRLVIYNFRFNSFLYVVERITTNLTLNYP